MLYPLSHRCVSKLGYYSKLFPVCKGGIFKKQLRIFPFLLQNSCFFSANVLYFSQKEGFPVSNQHFRTSINGFNKQDVVRYIELLNAQHNAQIAQLNNQLKISQVPADDRLQAKLDAALTKCAELEAQLAKTATLPASQELEAYRRAEQAERLAMERAQQIYTQANAILADTTAKAEAASVRIAELAQQANAQMQAYQDAIAGSQELFRDAVDALGAVKPEI